MLGRLLCIRAVPCRKIGVREPFLDRLPVKKLGSALSRQRNIPGYGAAGRGGRRSLWRDRYPGVLHQRSAALGRPAAGKLHPCDRGRASAGVVRDVARPAQTAPAVDIRIRWVRRTPHARQNVAGGRFSWWHWRHCIPGPPPASIILA